MKVRKMENWEGEESEVEEGEVEWKVLSFWQKSS